MNDTNPRRRLVGRSALSLLLFACACAAEPDLEPEVSALEAEEDVALVAELMGVSEYEVVWLEPGEDPVDSPELEPTITSEIEPTELRCTMDILAGCLTCGTKVGCTGWVCGDNVGSSGDCG